jgi:hypothetical protein
VISGTAPVRRYLRYLFGVFLLLDLLALALILDAKEGTHLAGFLVEGRNAVFSKFVSQRADLEAPPSELAKQGFLTDSLEERQRWFEILNSGVRFKAVFQQLEKTSSTIEKAKLITLSFSRNGNACKSEGEPVRIYDKTADLLFKLATIKEPRGFCSDHAQVFMALCSMVGLDAMEVSNTTHTTSAIYCPELHKWVWIDTQYALLAKRPNGEYMSPLEVRDANLKDEPFQYEFFGTPDHLFSKTDPRDFYPYRPADFSSVFEVEWGNNELTRDASNRQFLFVPTPIRQLISILAGVHPTYRYLNDEPQIAARYLTIKIVFYLMVLLFLIGNFAFPGYCLAVAIKESFSQPAVVGSAHIVIPEIVLESQGRTIAV